MVQLARIALVVVLANALPLLAESDKEVEKQLKQAIEGKQVVLDQPYQNRNVHLKMSRELQSATDGSRLLVLQVEKLSLKTNELQLAVRRVYLYQRADQIRGTLGPKEDLALRWKHARPDLNELLMILKVALPLLSDNPAVWPRYWPPNRDGPREPPQDEERLKPVGKEGEQDEPQPSLEGAVRKQRPTWELAPGIYAVGADAEPPQCDYCPDPEYTRSARLERVTGTVVLWIVVTETGRVAGIRLAKSLGHGLDEQAVMAVSNWHFRPARRGGNPIRVVFAVETSFPLY